MTVVLYHNINDQKIFFKTEKELVKWTRNIRDENEDSIKIKDTYDALAYIHSYCGNFDILKQDLITDKELLNY